MALVSTKLNVAYSMGGTLPKFIFTDVTDYSAQVGVQLTNITGVIEVTAPSGIVYTGGSPDITGSASRINSTIIPIPLLANGSPEVGNYSFKYTATNTATSVSVSYTVGYDFQYVSPTGILTPTVDCLSPELTSTDATNYLSGSTTPSDQFTITGVDTTANTFTIAGEKSGLFLVGDTFNIIGSTVHNGNYTVTSVSSTGTNTVIGVASVTNATVDGSISTKTNTIYYPPVLALPPVVGYTPVVSTSTFYSQTQSFKVSTKSFYDFGNGISVINTVSATSELDVDCDVRLCEVFCCVNSTLKAYLAYRGVNDVLASQELNKYILATSHLSALRQAFECGYDKEVNSIVQEIITVTQCTPDCSCSDTTPQPITGLGAANITVVNSTGNGVTVSPSTVGNTTTYSLGISQSLLNSITAATATSSVVSTNGSVTITSSTASGNTAYDLSIPAPAPAIAPVEFMNFKLNRDNSALFVLSDQIIQNVSNLKTPTFITNALSGQPGDHYELTLSGFQNTGSTTFKAEVQCCYQSYQPNAVVIDTTSPFYSYWITPEIIKTNNNQIIIKFTDKNNLFVYNGSMGRYPNMHLNIKIYE
jgi:hypothetical protein